MANICPDSTGRDKKEKTMTERFVVPALLLPLLMVAAFQGQPALAAPAKLVAPVAAAHLPG